jgi:hypothetical protein
MESNQLPKQVSMDIAKVALKFEGLTDIQAFRTIILYCKHEGLNCYYDSLSSTPSVETSDIETEYDDTGNCMYEIAKNYNYISGKIRLISFELFQSNVKMQLSVSAFSNSDKLYYPIDENHLLDIIQLNISDVYFEKEELIQFMKDKALVPTEAPSNIPITTDKAETNALKALALIARDMAEKNPAYMNGDKVNLDKFGKYITGLFDNHMESGKITDEKLKHGLNKIHGKLKTILEIDLGINKVE